ncbi:MAG TPA: Ig-like domain-containing protein [Mycobacteriales bacterium]|nr:Ig-like domain-containing protein [Mycobacteriales bacterium]
MRYQSWAARGALVGLIGVAAVLLPGPADAAPADAAPAEPAATSTAPATTTPPTTTPPATTPASTTPPADPGTVTVTESCSPGVNDTFTVHNTTTGPVAVTVRNFTSTFAHFTVPAGGTHDVLVPYAGAPYQLVFTRDDTGAELFRSRSFLCPTRVDRSYSVRAGKTVQTDPLCFPPLVSITRRPAHGSLRLVELADGEAARYTPAAGFVGTDSFDYECGASTNTLGTVTLHVLAAPQTSAAPPVTTVPPAGTALPNTGATRLPVLLGTGLSLLLAGALAVRLGRRRRPRHS